MTVFSVYLNATPPDMDGRVLEYGILSVTSYSPTVSKSSSSKPTKYASGIAKNPIPSTVTAKSPANGYFALSVPLDTTIVAPRLYAITTPDLTVTLASYSLPLKVSVITLTFSDSPSSIL